MFKAMFQNLISSWELKTMVAVIGGAFASLFQNTHFIVAVGFCALVFIDLFTKQMALSAQNIANKTGTDITTIDTLTKLWGIPLAVHDGVIRSRFMRDKFMVKLATYIFACVSAGIADIVIINTPDGFILNSMYSYLGATEFISILENLRDGGNTTVGRFVDFVSAKVMSKLK